MVGTWNRRTLGIALLAAVTGLGLLAKPLVGAAQSSREADGGRLLKGALDLHFHMDPWTPEALNGQAPGLYSVEAYDAANAILAGIKAGDTTRASMEHYRLHPKESNDDIRGVLHELVRRTGLREAATGIRCPLAASKFRTTFSRTSR